MTGHFVGYAALVVLAVAYLLAVLEEQIHLHKSKPVLLAAGIIWVLIGIEYQQKGIDSAAEVALRHSFLEYSELFFFLLVVKGFSYRVLFWITGILAFLISPIADNLTTALILCKVVMTVGAKQPKFVGIACVNIVVAANAGGAFSPFDDITTTLMVWQKGIINFTGFFQLFIPAVVNFMVPALCMHFSIPKQNPEIPDDEAIEIAKGGLVTA